jgi:hypothetical protein
MDRFEMLAAKAADEMATDVAAALKADQRYAPLVAKAADQVIRAMAVAVNAVTSAA